MPIALLAAALLAAGLVAQDPSLPTLFRLGPAPSQAVTVSLPVSSPFQPPAAPDVVLRVPAATPWLQVDAVLASLVAAGTERVHFAARLPDGGIAYAHRGGLAVFDAKKKLVMEHKAVAGPKGAETNSLAVLEGGKHFALMDSGVNEIRIVDQSGKWVSVTPLPDLKDDPLHFRYRMIREVPGANAFWVGQYGRKTVLKVEKGTGRVLQSIPLDPLLKPSPTVKKAFAALQDADDARFAECGREAGDAHRWAIFEAQPLGDGG